MPKGRNDGAVSSAAAVMRTIAADGYLAYIEWPVFLAHRLKQVQQHLTVTAAPENTDEPTGAASVPAEVAEPKPAFTGVKPLGGLAKKASVPKAKPADAGVEGELMRLLEGFDMQGEK